MGRGFVIQELATGDLATGGLVLDRSAPACRDVASEGVVAEREMASVAVVDGAAVVAGRVLGECAGRERRLAAAVDEAGTTVAR